MCTCDCGWSGSSEELTEVTSEAIWEDVALGYVSPEEVEEIAEGYSACPDCGSRVEPD